MAVSLSRDTLGLMTRFAQRHDIAGLWVSDGKQTQRVCIPTDTASQGNFGALALRYPLAQGLTLLVGVREYRQLDTEEQSELRRIIAAMDHHA